MNRSVASPLLLASALLSTACTSVAVPQGQDGGGSPAIQVSASSLTFVATAPGDDPASQFVSVGSAGTRALAAPTASVTYLEGSGWLSVAVEGDAAPYVVLVQPVTAGLAAGTYRATVSIACPGASNTPQEVLVALTVSSAAAPTMAVSPPRLAFTATAGGADPAPQALTVENAGTGALAFPMTVIYSAGSNWLSAAVSGSSAPYTVTVAAAPGGLAPGTYAGTILVGSAGATNSPVSVPVTLTLIPPPPAIAVAPASLSFTATEGGSGPGAQTLTVTSGNAGTLAVPTATVSLASGSGWLTASASGTSAPFTVTVTPAPGGLAAGTYQATVSIASAGATNTPVGVPVTLTVDPAPAAGTVSAASLTTQAAQPGRAVGDPPAVLVLDGSAHPVAGAAVAFEVVSGGGALAGAAATSGADGVARVTSWTLGPSGAQQVRALAPGRAGSPVTFDATLKAGAYEISLLFVNPPTVAQSLAFQRARERVEQVVTGDVPDVAIDLTGAQLAGCGGVPVHETVDDLLVVVRLEPIDGAGATLGQAGPCVLRGAGAAPVLGLMRFDTADLATLEASGRLDAVVLHEMLHVMGFGTLWSAPLLVGAGGTDPIFTGAGALDAFLNFDNGGTYAGAKVPVENSGGAGTRDSHWRDSVFRNELMTGYISGARQPLSRTTAAALADQGYAVDLAASDPFDIATAGLRLAGGAPDVVLGDDVLRIPLQVVEADGTVRPLR